MRLFPKTRLGKLRFALLFAVPISLGAGFFHFTNMPGESFAGPFEPLSPEEAAVAERLREHVTRLAGGIGARDVTRPEALESAALLIHAAWTELGFEVREQEYDSQGTAVRNLFVELPGASARGEIVVVGAHYDTAYGSPGADDNASGVAALLELSREYAPSSPAPRTPARTLRFVAFVNEEPPHFWKETMGSGVYADLCRSLDEDVVAMVSLESLGYFDAGAGSQRYPWPLNHFYGDRGDFIAFVGSTSSRELVHECIATFREHAAFPSEGIAAPIWIPGIGWSDHLSFDLAGYPAVMVTATAPFRNRNYHRLTDLPATLDYERMARVVAGLSSVVEALTRPPATAE
ncbi:MAG: M28 family peptidase [Planctomycetes bacterium]|nr:M28 family peptidase [Planctomycetota bacterium]